MEEVSVLKIKISLVVIFNTLKEMLTFSLEFTCLAVALSYLGMMVKAKGAHGLTSSLQKEICSHNQVMNSVPKMIRERKSNKLLNLMRL